MFCREEGDRRLKKRGNFNPKRNRNRTSSRRKQLRRRRGEPHAHEERHIPRVRWMCRAGNAGDAGTRLRAAVRARAAGSNGEAADFTQLREDVKGLMKKEPNVGPTLVRLAWHSCGTYDKMTKTGGSGGGTIRFKEELAHGNNAGLDKMVALLEPVKSKHPSISYCRTCTRTRVKSPSRKWVVPPCSLNTAEWMKWIHRK